MATILKTDGTRKNTNPKNKKYFIAKELNAVVDGYLEIIGLPNEDALMVLDEDGKRKDKPINTEATRLYRKNFPHISDFIVGDVLICGKREIK